MRLVLKWINTSLSKWLREYFVVVGGWLNMAETVNINLVNFDVGGSWFLIMLKLYSSNFAFRVVKSLKFIKSFQILWLLVGIGNHSQVWIQIFDLIFDTKRKQTRTVQKFIDSKKFWRNSLIESLFENFSTKSKVHGNFFVKPSFIITVHFEKFHRVLLWHHL